MVGPHSVILFEAKLTFHEGALIQITHLYRPLLQFIYKLPVVGVVVCKTLYTDQGDHLVLGPEELIDTQVEDIFTWHWLG